MTAPSPMHQNRRILVIDDNNAIHDDFRKGSTFWFTVELAKQAEGTALISKERLNLAGLHVLIVDDNPTNREILHHQLAAWKMRAAAVSSGGEALQMLLEAAAAGDPYQLAILDMNMPGMDGVNLAGAIKGNAAIAATRLVILSSLGQQLESEVSRAKGIDACLVKPVKQSILFDSLATAMAGPIHILAQPQQPRALVPASAKKARILLAEDNTINQQVAVGQLQKLGYSADVVANGLEALQALERLPYDIVLMDCQMPQMDGYEATRRIRQTEQNRPNPSFRRAYIIAMTANAMQGDRETCLAAGMDDYISKPVRVPDLKLALEKWSEGKSCEASPTAIATAHHGAPAGSQAAAKPSVPRMTGEAPVDLERLTEVTSENPESLRRLIGNYLKQAEEIMAGLGVAIQNGSADDIRHLAHKWGGSSSTCGMTGVVPALAELEQMGKSGELSRAAECYAETCQQFERMRHFLSENLKAA